LKPDYDKVALLAIRDNRILLCRKNRDTSLLITPGGCYEPGETAMECLNRELREELGDVRTGPLEYVGTYTHTAASDRPGPPKTVRVELHRGELIGEPKACAEIAELVWFGSDGDRNLLSPSLREKILPDLIARGILPWRD
jgi:8-oxo-dGTP pyrophosphatase MutT (NUDIX family)